MFVCDTTVLIMTVHMDELLCPCSAELGRDFYAHNAQEFNVKSHVLSAAGEQGQEGVGNVVGKRLPGFQVFAWDGVPDGFRPPVRACDAVRGEFLNIDR